MNIRKVKQGAKITLYNGIYMILFGFVYVFVNSYNMRVNFRAIGEMWGFFIRYDYKIAHLFILFNILIGLLMISNGIFIIYLSDFIIKRKEKITWVVLSLAGTIGWLAILSINSLLKNFSLIVLSIIGFLSFLLGSIIPIKYYLEKDYREY